MHMAGLIAEAARKLHISSCAVQTRYAPLSASRIAKNGCVNHLPLLPPQLWGVMDACMMLNMERCCVVRHTCTFIVNRLQKQDGVRQHS